MNFRFEVEKKNIRKAAMDYAIQHFKEKSSELTFLFTMEIMKIF
jgi:hypothetical protein